MQPSNASLTSAGKIGTTAGGQAAVFVVENLRARMQPIRIGVIRKNKVEILEGLEEGQEIVSRGLSDLKDNDRVRMKE
jgi:multidrug efflux pump subunit AcrA (membrane-fusion protein)